MSTFFGSASGMSTRPPTFNSSTPTVPSCIPTAIVTGANTGTGVNTLTFDDCYWAVADWKVTVDDINAATPILGFLGQFSNLGAGVTGAGSLMTCVLSTYTLANAAVDVALNTPIRFTIVFKKDGTGTVQ